MAVVTTGQNVRFNTTLDDVVVLDVTGDDRTVVMWNALSAGDQTLLTDIVNDLGGDAPMAGPVAGFTEVIYAGAVVGGTATGLNPADAGTSGTASIMFSADVLGTDESGLVTPGTATAGYQVVTNTPGFTAGSDATGLANTVAATAGKAYATFDVAQPGTDTATLPGSAGTYYFKVAVDGGAAVEYSIVTAGVNQSYNTIANLLDGAAGLDAAGVDVTYDAAGGRFVFTRKTTGATSTVVVTAGTTGTDIFEQIVTDVFPTSVTRTAVAGTAASDTTYTATITVDGVAKNISVVGSAAQTVTSLLAEINTDLGAAATASLVNGNIKVTSATTGSASTVSIVDGTLFAALTGTAVVSPAVAGTANTGSTKAYSAFVEVDGVPIRVSFTGLSGTTLTDVVNEINTDLGAAATATLALNSITITSSSTGPHSKVRVFDTDWLFSSLTLFNGVNHKDGTSPTTYTGVINVDGIDIPVSVVGGDAQTMTDLVTELNAALGAAATAAISNGKIRITSATTGPASNVTIVADSLFNKTADYTGQRSVVGASNLVEAFKVMRMPNGTLVGNYFPHRTVGARPPAPLKGITIPKTIQYIYWGGTPADWRYFNDDSVV